MPRTNRSALRAHSKGWRSGSGAAATPTGATQGDVLTPSLDPVEPRRWFEPATPQRQQRDHRADRVQGQSAQTQCIRHGTKNASAAAERPRFPARAVSGAMNFGKVRSDDRETEAAAPEMPCEGQTSPRVGISLTLLAPNPAMWVRGVSKRDAPSPRSLGGDLLRARREEIVEGHGVVLRWLAASPSRQRGT
jgi:hypothetical protein